MTYSSLLKLLISKIKINKDMLDMATLVDMLSKAG